jgi:hypothetical protein
MSPIESQMKKDLELIQDAYQHRNTSAPLTERLILQVGLHSTAVMLRKSRDYGDSIFLSPLMAPDLSPGEAIRVRLSDKLSRLLNLMVQENEAHVQEPIEDTLLDAANYILLMLMDRKRTFIAPVGDEPSGLVSQAQACVNCGAPYAE